MPSVTTDSLPGGWKLPVGCAITGASPNVSISFFTPSPSPAQLSAAIGSTAASPFAGRSVSITPTTLATLASALASFAATPAGQAPAVYAFWAAYGLFAAAGGL